MPDKTEQGAPVGVVPRRRATRIKNLLSDTPETCSVAETVQSPAAARARPAPRVQQLMSTVAVSGLVAAALEWLKLTR
jgi:hypothetical protein